MYDQILVPTDGNETGDALAHAESHADRYDARLVLLTVVEAADATADTDERHERRSAALADTVERLHAEGIDAKSVVETGVPARIVLEYAQEADLVVMATRARSGVGRVLFGSVTEQVIRDGDTPVLAVQR